MNSQLTIAIHIIGMIAWMEKEQNRPATSHELAESVGVHPVYVRETLTLLTAAGLTKGRRGRGGGTVLARAPEEITLAHVYAAVRDNESLLGRPRGDIGKTCAVAPIIKDYLAETFAEAESRLISRLAEKTVAALSHHVIETIKGRIADRRLEDESNPPAS